MKKSKLPPPATVGRTIRLHRDQFDLLATRMALATIARRQLDLVTEVAARHQQAQTDAVNAQQAFIASLTALGLDPTGQYQIDAATRTLTVLPPASTPKKKGKSDA